MAKKDTAYFRGGGGTIWAIDLPLPELYGIQLSKGELVRVQAEQVEADDGTLHWEETGPWTGGPTPVRGGGTIAVDPRDAEIARLQAELDAARSGARPKTEAEIAASFEVDPSIKPPTVSAPKADWVAYAVSQGMTVAEAEGATKNDLVELFGEK